MGPRKVGSGGVKPQKLTRKSVYSMVLQKTIAPYVIADLRRGGLAVEERLSNFRRSLERIPEAVRQHFQIEASESDIALGGIEGRSHLIYALVRHLGFRKDPQRVVELYGGGNFSGVLALPGTKQYVQVSQDPLVCGVSNLPEEFYRAIELPELANPALGKLAVMLPPQQKRIIEEVLGKAMPNLEYVQARVEDFARRPAQANRADLCIVFFWATAPSREMEMVVKPGGYLVTIDIQREQLAAIEATVEHEVTKDAEAVQDSIYREELTESFQKLLAETPGYRELNLSIVIMQKIKARA